MLRNYLSVALRHLRSNFSVSALNITGLAIGLLCFVLITVYITWERSYDRQYDSSDRLVRIELSVTSPQGTEKLAQTPPAWIPDIVEQHSGIETAVRVKPPRQKWMVGTGDRNYSERNWTFVDAGFLDMFDVHLSAGDAGTVLSSPMSVVISEGMATKYFSDRNPVGQLLTLDNQYDFEVTGVMADMPSNAHFRFDFLASFSSLYDSSRLYLLDARTFEVPFSYTYLQLRPGADRADILQTVQARAEASFAEIGEATGLDVRTLLRPVSDIHLNSDVRDEIAPTGSRETLLIFGAIALFILIIASINFMNLATAQSEHRAREVGVRKTVGAERRQLLLQFLGEAVLTAIIALVVAMLFAWILLPLFGNLLGTDLPRMLLFQPELLGFVVITALVVGLASGSYPAVYLSAFNAATVLKSGGHVPGRGRLTFRNVLVTAQFGISMVLIVATVTVYQQLVYVQNMDVGFDKEQVISIELTDPTPAGRFPELRDRMMQIPGVDVVSGGSASPAGLTQQGYARPEGAGPDDEWLTTFYAVNYDFFETFGIEMVAGRPFSREYATDSTEAIVINRAAAQLFGWTPEEAIGKGVDTGGDGQFNTIIGVTENFHSSSARHEVGPVILSHNWFHFYAFARLRADRMAQTVSAVEAAWKEINPEYEFDYTFIDERYATLYESETVMRRLLQYFAALTIIIACLGLFGLASFAAERRRKEIGVRKALGASVLGVSALLVRDLTRLVVPAFIIAAPVAWFIMRRWLEGFAYATDQRPLTYLLTFAGALLIAVATVGIRTIRAARVSPVKSLKYE